MFFFFDLLLWLLTTNDVVVTVFGFQRYIPGWGNRRVNLFAAPSAFTTRLFYKSFASLPNGTVATAEAPPPPLPPPDTWYTTRVKALREKEVVKTSAAAAPQQEEEKETLIKQRKSQNQNENDTVNKNHLPENKLPTVSPAPESSKQQQERQHANSNHAYKNNNDEDDAKQTKAPLSSTLPSKFKPTTTKTRPYYFKAGELEVLRENVDIVQVVESFNLGGFVLKRNGGGAMACCPFHDDRSPSLSIDSTRGLYHCFGCGAAGNVFTFVRHMMPELSFVEAVRFIQDEFAPTTSTTTMSRQHRRPNQHDNNRNQHATGAMDPETRDRLYAANAAAAAFYVDHLLRRPVAGGARLYLTSTRQLPPSMFFRFSLGYAPDAYYSSTSSTTAATTAWGKGSLVQHLHALNFTAQEMVDAGLAVVLRRSKVPLLSQPLPCNVTTAATAANKNATITIVSSNGTTTVNETKNNNQHNFDTTVVLPLTVDDVMDRFRGRIMVPILDATGKFVLGFGGRILPSHAEKYRNTNYSAPKYLNSPETAIFHKQYLLFGQQHSSAVKNNNHNNCKGNKDKTSSSIVVVEGYMDAIALTSVRIPHAVATMGTAISFAQLDLAAEHAVLAATATSSPPVVILWLDHDQAGQMAVERLCQQGLLASIQTRHPTVQFKVVVPTLASSYEKGEEKLSLKDPSDYVEYYRQALSADKSSNSRIVTVASMIQNDIIDRALPWSEWYIKRVVHQMLKVDDTQKTANTTTTDADVESLDAAARDVFHELACFLSESCFSNVVERSNLARCAATALMEFKSAQNSAVGPPLSSEMVTLKDQLKSDLLDLASRMEAIRNIRNNNADEQNEEKLTQARSRQSVVAMKKRLSAALGGGSWMGGMPESEKLSKHALHAVKRQNTANQSMIPPVMMGDEQDATRIMFKGDEQDYPMKKTSHDKVNPPVWQPPPKPRGKTRREERYKISRKSNVLPEPPLTPHFSGIEFLHTTDLEWIQSTDGGRGGNLMLDGSHSPDSIPRRGQRFSSDVGYKKKPIRPVYFNSNAFHGKFLTQEARELGYIPRSVEVSKDLSLFEKGVGLLVRPDTKTMALVAENALLRELILNPAARTFVKNWLAAKELAQGAQGREHSMSSSKFGFGWSNPGKEWLSQTLLNESSRLGGVGAKQPSNIRQLLVARDDVPDGAFSSDSAGDDVESLGEIEIAPHSVHAEEGVLDFLFVDSITPEEELSLNSTNQMEYYVQDLLIALSWASAQMESQSIQSNLAKRSEELSSLQADSKSVPGPDVGPQLVPGYGNDTGNLAQIRSDETRKAFDEEVMRLNQVIQQLRSIEELRRRTSTHALDANNALKIEGRLSSSVRNKLCSDMEDFVMTMGRQYPSTVSSRLHPGEEPYEDTLERIAEVWGEWAEEDYVWTPEEVTNFKHRFPTPVRQQMPVYEDEEEAESVDEFLDRIEKDYKDFL